MSRRSFAKASLLATVLGLAALGSNLTPAAALPSMHPGNLKALPSLPAQKPSGASMHPGSATMHVPQIEVAQTGPGAGSKLGGLTPKKPRIPNMQTPVGGPDPKPPIFGGGVDNVCPDNKFKCPPKGPAGPGTAGNFPQGPGSGPIVVLAQPPVFQAPSPVYQAPRPVYQAPRPVVTATSAAPVAAEPCNCLTKQYLDDGSVLFKDICTKEAAMATPDALKAQAQGAAPTVR